MPPKGFTKVGSLSQLAEGEMMAADISGGRVLIANVDGDVFAIADACPHAGAPMSEGYLTDNMVECPWHASVFNVMTGKHREGPSRADLTTYEVLVEGDDIFVGPEML
ncbi:MAG: non-heme iron oxygenase ferredoxin subunit [Dehalococcoidia bacterium]|nr:non-heme iron oxygenase ferredoxin subunit [Dehalococcoidia bacterium]MSQ34295.1 non-heme iron oxygenase ferredoxin subunit [Dehalococcoidia bacterium]